MGTDIFASLETRYQGAEWHGEELDLPRNYPIFDAIAGGRSEGGYLIYPRGFPMDASREVLMRYCNLVDDAQAEEYKRTRNRNRELGCAPIHSSELMKDDHWRVIETADGERFAYHFSPFSTGNTWLTLEEFERCCAVTDDRKEEWNKLICRMREIEQNGGQTRFISGFFA